MIESVAAFFPPEFTAVAQWSVCTLHILCNEKRLRGWKLLVLILAAFPILLAMNKAHASQPAPIWLFVMSCCLMTMMIFLRLGMKANLSVVLQHWCHALMQAEFVAALAYLVTVYLRSLNMLQDANGRTYLSVMLVVYLL